MSFGLMLTPACLQAEPVAASVSLVGAKADPALSSYLEQILADDQQGRQQLEAVRVRHGFKSPEVLALWKDIAAKDAENLAKVRAFLDTHGWLGPDRVGTKGNRALFLVIQHADLDTQKRYLPLLREAVKNKCAFAHQLALLEDRVALAEGRRQRYGSQMITDMRDGRVLVAPLEDPSRLEELRRSMGLPPMSVYVRSFQIDWSVEAYLEAEPLACHVQWGGAPRPEGHDEQLRQRVLEWVVRSSASWEKYREKIQALPLGQVDEEALALAQALDRQLAAELVSLIDRQGWITPAQVGKHATSGMMNLLLGATDLPTKQRLLPLLREAAAARQADVSAVATLEDMVAVAEGRPQRYGTQVVLNAASARYELPPIEDGAHVEERRRAVFLEPLVGFLRRHNLRWDPVKFRAEFGNASEDPLKGKGDSLLMPGMVVKESRPLEFKMGKPSPLHWLDVGGFAIPTVRYSKIKRWGLHSTARGVRQVSTWGVRPD